MREVNVMLVETRRRVRQRRTATRSMLVLTAVLFAFLLLTYWLDSVARL